ncbi:hypothetical protein NQD34_013416 [Periophthalmus magnuspinnatus]|nr:hypothetical protein NQD34_013416 [Periophthalmus magnuspinnatus]
MQISTQTQAKQRRTNSAAPERIFSTKTTPTKVINPSSCVPTAQVCRYQPQSDAKQTRPNSAAPELRLLHQKQPELERNRRVSVSAGISYVPVMRVREGGTRATACSPARAWRECAASCVLIVSAEVWSEERSLKLKLSKQREKTEDIPETERK